MFGSSTVEGVEADIEVPPTSLACPDVTQEAYNAAIDAKDDLDQLLTENSFYLGFLSTNCEDLESDYAGLYAAQLYKIIKLEGEVDAFLAALYVFKQDGDEDLD